MNKISLAHGAAWCVNEVCGCCPWCIEIIMQVMRRLEGWGVSSLPSPPPGGFPHQCKPSKHVLNKEKGCTTCPPSLNHKYLFNLTMYYVTTWKVIVRFYLDSDMTFGHSLHENYCDETNGYWICSYTQYIFSFTIQSLRIALCSCVALKFAIPVCKRHQRDSVDEWVSSVRHDPFGHPSRYE